MTARRPAPRLAGAALAALLLAACGGSDDTTGSAAAGGEATGWSFTDDLGTTLELDERPDRVVALTDVAASLFAYDVAPVATFGWSALAADSRFEGFDTSGTTDLGTAYGEIDLEQLAAADPDVIVTHAYPVDSEGTIDDTKPLYGFTDLAQQEAAAEIAPIVAVAMRGSAVDVVERTEELAVSLGADRADVDAAREEYAAAAERLRAAGERDLDVLVGAAYPGEGVYVAKAQDDPVLRAFGDLGVDFVDPGGEGYYWETLSWENIGTLPADVVLESERAMPVEEMQRQPTFARTPAASSDQVHRWVFAALDSKAQAAWAQELAGHLEQARDVA
ncbi:ABC transporter substrate-binding protein [Vallicoccus soli]|uniref:ABC transporter substrate-binding protein n=1 Tax=Vallicoccus soli TaxID=2339232 RepID=A0A3A3ZEE6_9ACTN|nr:ABC transporter substrate-binding protein [Vallicoccus soli]RJK93389.1 ABC transporter substrate-binding protein [Vallicoccus soli]